MLIAIVAVLVGVFFAATGRGGELAYEHADYPPLDLGPVSAADIALLRPPTALWGYNIQVTDEALQAVARAMRDRDVTIAYLRQQLANLEPSSAYPEPEGAHARQAPGDPPVPEVPQIPKPPQTRLILKASLAAKTVQAPEPPEAHEATQPSEALQDLEAHEATQPSEALQDLEAHEATQPSEVLEATRPAEALQATSYDTQGPQGSYDTHDWWAQQHEAARAEEVLRQAGQDGADETALGVGEVPPGDAGPPHQDDPAGPAAGPRAARDDDALAAAEEQGW